MRVVVHRSSFLALFVFVLSASGCAPSPSITAPTTATPSFQLPQPHVRIDAEPPPPFTYWAPDGAVIRNHANPGIWVAFLNGRNVATYFGDACHASDWQRFKGQPLSALPPPPPDASLRTSCTSCAVNDDLRPNRINVRFDEATQTIVEIACF